MFTYNHSDELQSPGEEGVDGAEGDEGVDGGEGLVGGLAGVVGFEGVEGDDGWLGLQWYSSCSQKQSLSHWGGGELGVWGW